MVTWLALGYLSLWQPEKQKDSPGLQLLLYHMYMTYTVTCHLIRHLPEIRYDVYDIMSQVTAVGIKPTTITLPTHSSHNAAVGGLEVPEHSNSYTITVQYKNWLVR